jgi:hypothetical protein
VVLECYHDYLNIFSKEVSNTLPPAQPYNHKIKLIIESSTGYCLLYKMLLKELEAAKQYIQENLDKGFIVPSQAPFALLILIIRKHNGALCLYINYQKLNAITKKDQYPLPLINKLLEQLSKAKIFTKINICQGFHRIQIYPDSEDMTIFRTRYGSYKYKVMSLGLTNGLATF